MAHPLWRDAKYAVILLVAMVLIIAAVRLIGSNANNVFFSVSSAIQ